MIRKVAKYINYDDNKFAYRVVLKGNHIGYFKTLTEAIRHRNRHCLRLKMKVPDDDPQPVPINGGLENQDQGSLVNDHNSQKV